MTPHFRGHTYHGDVRPGKPTGSGFHYRPGGQDWADRRLVPGTVKRDPLTGAYTARPEFLDRTVPPPPGVWKPKGGNNGVSSFFPDHWTPAQVDAAIGGAFRNSVRSPGGDTWIGQYGGLTIEGYHHGAAGYTHGWPVL
jgi:hypothetical protein